MASLGFQNVDADRTERETLTSQSAVSIGGAEDDSPTLYMSSDASSTNSMSLGGIDADEAKTACLASISKALLGGEDKVMKNACLYIPLGTNAGPFIASDLLRK